MSDLAHPKLIVAIVAAIIVVVAIWISVSVSRWRRITWRDHMDTQIGALSKESGPKEGRESGPWAIWKVLTHHEEVAQPSLVLVRIRNSGLLNISRADVRRPLTFTFPGRVIKEYTITDCRGVSRQDIQPPGDLGVPQAAQSAISLPRFPMRRKAQFKLLVLLSGAGRDIVADGRLRRGSVLHESRARGPLARNIAFGSVLLLLVGIQAGFTFGQASAAPSYCASGRLTLEGSTAFAPTAQAIGTAYAAACQGAAISVSAIATFNGLNAVADAGATTQPSTSHSTAGQSTTGQSAAGQSATGQSTTGQSAADESSLGQAAAGLSSTGDPATATVPASGTEQIAMSDGPAPAGYPTLVGHAIAVMLFAVVVNKQLGIYNLTTAQLRGIWLGNVTNWDQLGGPNLSIKIVARTTASGTRRIFDQKILAGKAEPAFSSYNCVSNNAVPSSPVIRCEVSDTGTLLQKVNSIPGAIGYAQVSDAATYPDVSAIKINGSDPTIGEVKNGAYPYWTVEYLYTAGNPAPGSLAAGFLSYMQSTASDDTLRTNEYTPCVDRGQSLMKTLCGQLFGEGAVHAATVLGERVIIQVLEPGVLGIAHGGQGQPQTHGCPVRHELRVAQLPQRDVLLRIAGTYRDASHLSQPSPHLHNLGLIGTVNKACPHSCYAVNKKFSAQRIEQKIAYRRLVAGSCRCVSMIIFWPGDLYVIHGL